ncbi:MAG: SpoIIE family protein phosphatase, partial [Umezawaea sp.]
MTGDPVALAAQESLEDLYEHAPCGYLSTSLDGRIVRVNTTLLSWLGYSRDQVVGGRRFADLLTVGGRIYHETHFAPLLGMQGEAGGIALEMVAADGRRLPVLVTSKVRNGEDGRPALIRTTVFDARDRRAYEQELLRARREADVERDRYQRLARTLQRSLLPPALAAVPGVEVAAYYHPASVDEVGGDFYDLFPLAPDRWGLFLGDVCGKGADAAAVTSVARYTLRAAAVHDSDPRAVLRTLDTVLRQHGGHRFCTVVFGLLTPTDDGCTVALAGGGHPPALLLRADGVAEPQ